ncbi:MAG TPA: zf-HC2 domain-containing protein [Rhodothermales bacterium]|nr:zf-HC2 domain-containing protein [Rhodothermales bacterium]
MSMFRHFLHRRSELSCKDVNEFLVAYGEGGLEDSLRERFENHLERCPCCKTYLDQYQTTVALVKDAGADQDIRPHEELVQLTLAFLRESLADSGEGSGE